jgi:hypothetical protein
MPKSKGNSKGNKDIFLTFIKNPKTGASEKACS